MIRTVFALALACVGSPALAQQVAASGDRAVVLPWGDWIVAIADGLVHVMLPVLVPLLAGYAIHAIRKVYPWAVLFLTQRRVEMMIQAGADYGRNAVAGAAKGKVLSIPVGSDVIRAGTQYLLDAAPGAVVTAVGGADGIAQMLFRKIDLEPAANVENTLLPAVEWLDRNVPAAKARGR